VTGCRLVGELRTRGYTYRRAGAGAWREGCI